MDRDTDWFGDNNNNYENYYVCTIEVVSEVKMNKKEALKQLESMAPAFSHKFKEENDYIVDYYTKSQVQLLIEVICSQNS